MRNSETELLNTKSKISELEKQNAGVGLNYLVDQNITLESMCAWFATIN